MKKSRRRFFGLILALAPLHTAPAAELLYVPLVLDNLVLTYDISSLNAVEVKNSERTFISSNIFGPNGIAFDPSGNVYVSNGASNSISKFGSTGNFLSTIGSSVTLADPAGLAVDSQGNLYAANFGGYSGESDALNNTVAKFDSAGTFVGAISSNVNRPFGVLVDAADNLYVGNWFTNNISKFDSSGTFQTDLGDSNNIDGPMGLGKDSFGNIFVANLNAPLGSNVTKFNPAGLFAGYIGESANLTNPAALAIDSAGNLYVSSGISNTAMISKFDSLGALQFSWTIPSAANTMAIAVPEPSSIFLLLLGAGALIAYRVRIVRSDRATSVAGSASRGKGIRRAFPDTLS
jgi:sugar lactone lactonase YvrE